MLSLFSFVTVAALGVLSLTRRRIYVICGFYCFVALLTVLDEGNVPHLGGLTVYRALYLIILISLVARLVQDRGLMEQMRRCPLLPYFGLIIILLASSLYSSSTTVFSTEDSFNVWSRLASLSLFWTAASHIHDKRDFKIVAGVTVAVSLVLSLWVIWSAARFDFSALRGGIEVNQNYVSVFVVLGAIPLLNVLFQGRNLWRLLCLPLLLCVVLSSLILASRGMMAGFFFAGIVMVGMLFRRVGGRTMLVLALGLALVFTVAMFLPGAQNFLERFHEGNVGTLNDRTLVWAYSFDYFGDSGVLRMVFGQGLSSEPSVLGPAMTIDLINYHNLYLQWLMSQGIVGLGLLLAFLYSITRRILRSDHSLRNVMVGWLSFLLVAGFSSTIADTHAFWIILGVVAGACALTDDATTSPARTATGSDSAIRFSRPTPGRALGIE